MRIYYDTEYTSDDGNVDWDMISAGFVAEDGRELYIEITDFNRDACSQFVVDTVLPLLGKGDRAPERIASEHFAWRLRQWLESFGEPVCLVADASGDWFLLNGYCYTEFGEMRQKPQGRLWQPSSDSFIQAELAQAELRFWTAPESQGMQHHALYDARRLKMLAEIQRKLREQ